MKHAQGTEKYIRLIFNSNISEADFFLNPCALQSRTIFFLEIFKAKRGCTLCTNAHYTTLNTVYLMNRTISYFLIQQSPFYIRPLSPKTMSYQAILQIVKYQYIVPSYKTTQKEGDYCISILNVFPSLRVSKKNKYLYFRSIVLHQRLFDIFLFVYCFL